jgi:hypothetical protein
VVREETTYIEEPATSRATEYVPAYRRNRQANDPRKAEWTQPICGSSSRRDVSLCCDEDRCEPAKRDEPEGARSPSVPPPSRYVGSGLVVGVGHLPVVLLARLEHPPGGITPTSPWLRCTVERGVPVALAISVSARP